MAQNTCRDPTKQDRITRQPVLPPAKISLLRSQQVCQSNQQLANSQPGFRGDTVDISQLLKFSWCQPVLCLDPTASFPESKEKPGHFVGFAENTGDTMAFLVLTEDKKTALACSVVRPANDPKQRTGK